MKILIGTKNPGKYKEFETYIKKFGHETISLTDLGIDTDVEETGETFLENALLKARFFCQASNMPALSDDSGIEIDALNGEPGVKSRRWNGTTMTDQELIDYTLERLKDTPENKRTAKLTSTVVLVFPDGRELIGTSSSEGIITDRPITPIIPGYPFRSIFYVPQFKKVLGELTPEQHEQIHHRVKALKIVLDQI